MAERVIVYIDGFNLYHGLKSRGWKGYYWLNPLLLGRQLCMSGQNVEQVKYYTARITGPEDKRLRQSAFIDAVKTLEPAVRITYGRYAEDPFDCPGCALQSMIPTEKKTDVNLAVALLDDGYEDRLDTAIVVSGDSDLVPAIKRFRDRSINNGKPKSVVVAFPPDRISKELKQVANHSKHIDESMLRNSQFPDLVRSKSGHPLTRPDRWRRR